MIAASDRALVDGRSAEHAPTIDAWARRLMNRHPAVGFAAGVVRGGALEFFYAHGLADIASETRITSDTVFRIASITKTFTAVAVAQLWERGLVDLDAPATEYLRAYELAPAHPGLRPPTLRELLTHTAGLPAVVYPWRALRGLLTGDGLARLTEGGASFEIGKVPTLAGYYKGSLRLEAEPGARFTYGDHGYATAGQIVEDVTGSTLDRYFHDAIFVPLGMTDTDLLRSPHVISRLATGYVIGPRGPRPVRDREWVTSGASNIYSTPRDMARYLAALVGGGANDHGRILRAPAVAALFQPHFRTDPRVGGIGLGFFRTEAGGHVLAEHQGILPGFDSQIYLAPDDGVAVMAFTNGTRNGTSWLPSEASGFLRELLGVEAEGIKSDVAHHPEVWENVCGWYPLSANLADTQAKSVVGLGAEVFVRRGQLALRTLSPIPAMFRGLTLHPDDSLDPYAFRLDLSQHGIGTVRIVFSPDSSGATRIHSDWIPLSIKRRPGARSPRLAAEAALAAVAVGATVAVARNVTRHRLA